MPYFLQYLDQFTVAFVLFSKIRKYFHTNVGQVTFLTMTNYFYYILLTEEKYSSPNVMSYITWYLLFFLLYSALSGPNYSHPFILIISCVETEKQVSKADSPGLLAI